MSANAKIILDTRRLTKKGYPIKIRVTINKKSKYIGLNEHSSLEFWNNDSNVTKNHPDCRRLCYKLNKRASLLIEEVNYCYCNDNKLGINESFIAIGEGHKRQQGTAIKQL